MIAGVALAQEDTSQTAAQEGTSLPAPEPVVPAPGRVQCLVSDNGQAVRGELSDANGQRADCAQGLELPPGLHRVEVHRRERRQRDGGALGTGRLRGGAATERGLRNG